LVNIDSIESTFCFC